MVHKTGSEGASYLNSVSFIEFLRVFCIHDKLCVKIILSEKILLSFKSLKLAQNLHSNKTGFVRLGHILYLKIFLVNTEV